MPKDLFLRLSDDKKEKIYNACLEEFNKYPFQKAKVSHIVEKLGIARGSFYQYFEDLKDCYFYVLGNEIDEMHGLFMQAFRDTGSLELSLERYMDLLVKYLFDEKKYDLYKNRYLYWSPELEESWNSGQSAHFNIDEADFHKAHIVKAVIHDLIYRLYLEGWSKEEFVNHYENTVKILKEGI